MASYERGWLKVNKLTSITEHRGDKNETMKKYCDQQRQKDQKCQAGANLQSDKDTPSATHMWLVFFRRWSDSANVDRQDPCPAGLPSKRPSILCSLGHQTQVYLVTSIWIAKPGTGQCPSGWSCIRRYTLCWWSSRKRSQGWWHLRYRLL